MTAAAEESAGFAVHLDVFEGPFDLLLGLIAKHQLDITEISLGQVTDDFIAYIRAMGEEWDLDEASEFLVVAATLLDLKAARLLPSASVEDEEDLHAAACAVYAVLLGAHARGFAGYWRTPAVLRSAEGPVAELLHFAAHPTVVPRDRPLLDPDWPGRLSLLREERGGVVLVLQGTVGNVSMSYGEGEGAQLALSFARAVSDLAERAVPAAAESTRLAFARVEVALPRPDASRLVPSYSRAAGDNFLCASSSRTTEVGALVLGPLELVLIPGEPTVGAGAALVRRTGGTGVLGLADGYVGYVETPAKVEEGAGEARRQYFGPTLLDRLGTGAELAARTAGFTP